LTISHFQKFFYYLQNLPKEKGGYFVTVSREPDYNKMYKYCGGHIFHLKTSLMDYVAGIPEEGTFFLIPQENHNQFA
jgi:hypothetical protein